MTLQEMIAFQPHAEEILRVYDRHVDAEGRTTLNIEEYMAYRAEMKVKAEQKNKQKKAKKGAKKLM